MSRICRNVGDSEKPRFYELNHESKMRLLKTYSHTSERPDYEARKTRRKLIEGNADPMIRQMTHQKPDAYRRRGGGRRDEKGTMAKQNTEKGAKSRQTIVEGLPRTVSVVGGARRRKTN